MQIIAGNSAPELYVDGWAKIRICGVEENSRNGRVLAMPGPTLIQMHNPLQRVLFDPDRDANPFFHVMEAVWMFGGFSNVEWIEKFNKRYREYAEPNGEVWGAYGHRWMSHFGPSWAGENPMNQITAVIRVLKKDLTTRQAVIAMWDPAMDLEAETKDRPCNTHIYFRVQNGALDMTVCNRSNDMVWGALGANIVHMTYLHELIARGVGIPLGIYRVFTNNLHVYQTPEIMKLQHPEERYWYDGVPGIEPYPLLQGDEEVQDLLEDCIALVENPEQNIFMTQWAEHVAYPMRQAYLDKKRRAEWVENVRAKDWKLACQQWVQRRGQSSVTSTEL